MIAANTIVGGRYRVVKPLGGGGMKLVYLAEDLRLAARRCALAEMVDSFTSPDAQKQAIAAFQREADMLAQLNNEHIPRVFDRFSEANHHYLVMEYIDGETLEDELRESGGRLAPDRIIEIAIQVLDTLEYLHHLEPPVIYRDLKPSNVMVTSDGKAKLIDFGIARHFQPLTNATMIGTQGYAPPEQYRGKVEIRSDIYALGATMHHSLSGRDPAAEPPFSFPPLRKLMPDVDSRLAATIDQALAYDVNNRIGDAAEFKRRLIEIQTGPLSAAPDTAAVATPRTSARPQMQLPLSTSQAGSASSASPPRSTPHSSSTPKPATPNAPTLLSVNPEMPCPRCHRSIPSDSRFCSYCAENLTIPLTGATHHAAAPGDETVILAPNHSPPAQPNRFVERFPRTAAAHRRRSGLRHPLLLLLIVFLAAFVIVKLIFLSSPDTAPASYNTGSTDMPRVNPANPANSDPRLAMLQQALVSHGYKGVHLRMDSGTLIVSGSVPTEFDRVTVQMMCANVGIFSLQDDLSVTGDDFDSDS